MLTSDELREVLPDPIKTVKELDKYVIGQQEAKKTLALMLLNRAIVKLYRAGKLTMKSVPEKTNVLMVGSTGTGKTALLRALEKVAGVPVSMTEVTNITEQAYIGGKVEDILINHVKVCTAYTKAHYDTSILQNTSYEEVLKENIETGIIYIDEIDKVHKTSDNRGSGSAVQNELLKILENGNVTLDPTRWKSLKEDIKTSVDTRDIFFVAGGAFSGLDEIIERRHKDGSSIGFHSNLKKNRDSVMADVTTEDLVKYGMKPELLGRLPMRTHLEDLSLNTLMAIITSPDNSLFSQYYDKFRLFGIHLVIDKEALHAIASHAVVLKMGARSLKTILEKILSTELYNVFKGKRKRLRITKELVEERISK